MPDGSNVIQEFMVSLGFRVNQSEQNKFRDALKENHLSIERIGKGMKGIIDQFAFMATSAVGSAVGLSAALVKVADQMAQLGFQSQRIGSDPGNVRALSLTFERMGINAEHAREMMEGMANAARLNPGLLQAFGVHPGATVTQAMVELADRWQKLIAQGATGMSQAVQEAGRLGISQRDMLAITSPEFRKLYEEQRRLQDLHGLNLEKLTKQSIELSRQMQNLETRFSSFGLYIEQTWGPKLETELGKINLWFDQHTPQINRYLDGMSNNFDNFTGSVTRWYQGLQPTTQSALEQTGLFAAGALAVKQASSLSGFLLRMVGLGSLSGPIGALMGLGGGILLLANDYTTWKATGGKDSLIDWSRWEPSINAAKKAIGDLNANYLGPLADKLGVDRGLLPAFEGLAAYLGGAAFLRSVKGGLGWVLRALASIPGSGVTAAALSPLGLAITVPLALGGDTGPMTPEQQKAWDERLKQEEEDYRKKYPNYTPPGGWKPIHPSAYITGGGGSSELVALVTAVVGVMRQLYGDTGGAGAANANDFGANSARLLQAVYPGAGVGGGGNRILQAAFRTLGPPAAGMGGAEGTLASLENWQGLPGGILDKVWAAESGRGRNLGPSSAGAMGPFQFMPGTAKRFGVDNPMDFQQSATGAARYLHDLLREFKGDTAAALAGYNWGEQNVEKAMKQFGADWFSHVPPETAGYVNSILNSQFQPRPGAAGDRMVKNISITAPTNVDIAGVSDPHRVAQLVDRNVDRKNANLIRHLRTAYL